MTLIRPPKDRSEANGWMVTLEATSPSGESLSLAIRLSGDGDDSSRLNRLCRQLIDVAEQPTSALAMALLD